MSEEKSNSIGNYQILASLGSGGSGQVYRAKEEKLAEEVALKVMHGGAFVDSDEALRFRLSAESAAGLDHPGIVPIYEIGEHDQTLFVAMKLIEGGTVEMNPPTGTKGIAGFMKELCDALEHAHARGVLHGDLKPSNLLLTESGQPMLSDFIGSGDEQDDFGTPAYMAPERLAGGEMTVATDVYGLGALLYEFLAERPVFEGESALEVSRKVLHGKIVRPGGDRELEILCLACLAREPGERPGSVSDLRDEFVRILRGEAIRTRRVSRFTKLKKWGRRNPLEVALLLLLVGVGLVGMIHPSVRIFPELNAPDRFGSKIAASENHLVVAAQGSGLVEVFELGDEIDHIGKRQFEADRRMGRSLLVDGDQVFIGGFSTAGRWRGVVDILNLNFLDAPGSRLIAEPLDSEYGESLAKQGERLWCGGPGGQEGEGALVIFSKEGRRPVTVKNPNPNEWRLFGYALACEGEILAVGAPGSGKLPGKVIICRVGKTGRLKILSKFSKPGQFGWSLSMKDGHLLVGAPAADSDRGAAYLIDLESHEIRHELSAENGQSGDRFGEDVALAGSMALIGAPQTKMEIEGAGYVIGVDVSSGEFRYRLESPKAARGDSFGDNIAVGGDRVFVSAERYFHPEGLHGDPANEWGRVEVFDLESGEFETRLRSHQASELNTKPLVIYGVMIAVVVLFVGYRKFFREKM